MDLLKFCADEEEYPDFLQPFSAGDYTYATDGAFAIRVPRINRYEYTGNGKSELIDDLIDKVPHTWQPVPDFTLPDLMFLSADEEIPSKIVVIDSPVPFDVNGDIYRIGLCYLSWVVNLPESSVSFDRVNGDSGNLVMSFKFAGGAGVVMTRST